MKFKRSLIGALVAMAVSPVWAANGILLNEYVKAGVNESTGTFGSGGNTSPGLLYDSTGAGSFNTSYDYLTPGSPFDGFTVRLEDGSGNEVASYINNNTGMIGITGAWVSAPTSSTAIWEGSTTEFTLRNTYSLPAAQPYIDITSQITALEAIPVLYFGRYIDPDARAAAGDSSSTDNALGYGAIPAQNVVFSEALASRYALGLYTAQNTGTYGAGISPGWSTNPIDYLNNTNGEAVVRGDYTIGLGFKVSGLSIGDVVAFNYAYIFGPSAFGAATTAIDGGAGGGTPGETPSGETLTDVGSATDAASGASEPTVVSEVSTKFYTADWTNWATNSALPIVYGSLAHHELSIVNGRLVVARETTTTTTTPQISYRNYEMRTVTTYSDSTTSTGAATSTGTDSRTQNNVGVDVVNDGTSAPVDTLPNAAHLDLFTQELNQPDVLSRVKVSDGKLSRRDGKSVEVSNDTWVWLNYKNNNGNNNRGYGIEFGGERLVTDNFMVGVQLNYNKAYMNNVESGSGKFDTTMFNLYAVRNFGKWAVKPMVGYASSNYDVTRTMTLGSVGVIDSYTYTNSFSPSGKSYWADLQVFAPQIWKVTPYAGVAARHYTIDGGTESGSTLTALTWDKASDTVTKAYLGAHFDSEVGARGLFLTADARVTKFDLNDSKSTNTVESRYGETLNTVNATLGYKVNKQSQIWIGGTYQDADNYNNRMFSIGGKIDF